MYNSLAGSSYMKLPKKLDYPREGLINIRNTNDKCFKLILVRYLHPVDHNPKRIKKLIKILLKSLILKREIREKIEKKNSIPFHCFWL